MQLRQIKNVPFDPNQLIDEAEIGVGTPIRPAKGTGQVVLIRSPASLAGERVSSRNIIARSDATNILMTGTNVVPGAWVGDARTRLAMACADLMKLTTKLSRLDVESTLSFAKLFFDNLVRSLDAFTLREEAELGINVESDGHINFSWYVDGDHVFEASVSEIGAVYFAGRFGDDRIQGKEHVRFPVSTAILSKIHQFYAQSNRYLGTFIINASVGL